MPNRVAYLPLNTYPEAPSDAAILRALDFAQGLGLGLHATTFAVDIPPVAVPFGGYMIDVDGMVREAEKHSKAEAERLQALVASAAKPALNAQITNRRTILGAAFDAAATEARYFDLTVLPWDEASVAAQDMAQALVFGTGLPVILVPSVAQIAPLDHIAIAWDESRVAARALNAALPLLAAGGQVSILTVQDEKSLTGSGLAETLAASLDLRGYRAIAQNVTLQGRTIAGALQEAAITGGAKMLVMGGFGHSRLRDFILGGATKGVFGDLRMPVLMSH